MKSRGTLVLASAAFTLSGATSLVFQVVWSKALGYVLGNSQYAVATVVAAYLAGLALGAWLAGRIPLLLRRPLVTYGVLETGIGVFGFASLALLSAIAPLVDATAHLFPPGGTAYVLVRFLLTFALLLVPTAMMGATLPVLVHWASDATGRVAGMLSRLYALNTTGGVIGTLTAGFVLLPQIGLAGSARIAASICLLLGATVVLIGRKLAVPVAPATAAPAAAAATPPPLEEIAWRRRLAAVLVLVSGGVALVLEIGWTRLTALLFGSSVYSFTLVLAAFLVGIALGAAIVERFIDRVRRPWLLFAALQWLLAAAALWGSARMAQVPWEFVSLLLASGGKVGALWFREGLVLATCVVPAAAALGALFPISGRLLAIRGEPAARLTGRLYLVNTLGTVAGSVLAGFWLVPHFGMQKTLLGAATVAAVIGMIAWAAAPWTSDGGKQRKSELSGGPALSRLMPIALAAAALVLSLVFQQPWNRALLASGVFRPLVAGTARGITTEEARAQLSQRLAEEETIFYREGLHAVATVVRLRARPDIIALRVNGKTDASTDRDMRTQVLLGKLPILWSPDSSRVCVVGLGSGITVGNVLDAPVKQLDVVELEPAVVEASRYFDQTSGTPLADPRVRLVIEDGRSFLRQAKPGTYDAISSEPSNPWLAGVNNLFTEDFYRLAASRLTDDGVLVQWIQFYELSEQTLASIVHAIHRVFPHGDVFESGTDILVVARKHDRPLDIHRAYSLLAGTRAAANLARVDLPNPASVLSLRVTTLDAFDRSLPAAPPNTDDRPTVEYRAPRDFYTVPPGEPPVQLARLLPEDPWADLPRWASTPDTSGFAVDLAMASFLASDTERGSRWRFAIARHAPERAATLEPVFRDFVAQNAKNAALAAAEADYDAGRVDAARQRADMFLHRDPDDARFLVLRGRIAMSVDSLDAAQDYLVHATRTGDEEARYRASLNLGIIAMRRQEVARGVDWFRAAGELRPLEAEPQVYLARALAQTGRAASADSVLLAARGRGVDASAINQERARLGLEHQ